MDRSPMTGQIGEKPPISVRSHCFVYAKVASLSFLSAATLITKFLAA